MKADREAKNSAGCLTGTTSDQFSVTSSLPRFSVSARAGSEALPRPRSATRKAGDMRTLTTSLKLSAIGDLFGQQNDENKARRPLVTAKTISNATRENAAAPG